MVMPRPAGVMVVSVWFIFVGVVIGFLAVVLLTGSFGLVQRGGTTGIFANGFVGGVGIFLAAVILPVAMGVVALGVGLWRLRQWARIVALGLMALNVAFSISALRHFWSHFGEKSFFWVLIFIISGLGMIWYISRAEVKAAFGPYPDKPLTHLQEKQPPLR